MKNYFTEADERLKWKTLSEKVILNTVVFDVTVLELLSRHCRLSSGKCLVTMQNRQSALSMILRAISDR